MENKFPTIKILVACHKADPNIRQDNIYLPIQVGKSVHPSIDLGFQCDNTGDNISDKNESYCELTALYWSWKNLKNVDYIGLCHYRRYFDLGAYPEKRIINWLNKYDVLALKRRNHIHSVATELSLLLTQEDVAILINHILLKFPNSKQAVVDYFYRNNKSTQCNMLIMKKDRFDKYCSQIFPFLNSIEKELKPYNYTRLKRNIGYIAEALMGFIFIYDKYKVKYINKVDIETINTNKLQEEIRRLRNNLLFSCLRKPTTPIIYPSVITGLINDNYNIQHLK